MLRTKDWLRGHPAKKKTYWLGKADDCESGRETPKLEDYSATSGMAQLSSLFFVLGH